MLRALAGSTLVQKASQEHLGNRNQFAPHPFGPPSGNFALVNLGGLFEHENLFVSVCAFGWLAYPELELISSYRADVGGLLMMSRCRLIIRGLPQIGRASSIPCWLPLRRYYCCMHCKVVVLVLCIGIHSASVAYIVLLVVNATSFLMLMFLCRALIIQ